MANYRLSNQAQEDLIRIHQYGVLHFGIKQADSYFESFFKHFDIIGNQPLSFESVDYIKQGYRRCPCGKDSIYYRISDEVVEIMTIIRSQDLSSFD